MAADSVFAVDEHPQSGKPLLQRDRRILKDGLDLDGELASAVATLPALLSLDVVGILGIAIWALGASGPAHQGYGVNTDLLIAKVLNRFK